MIKKGQEVTPRMKAMCLSKTKHTSMLAAQYALDNMVRLPHSGKLNIYTCDYCGALHIGKEPKKKRYEQDNSSNGITDSDINNNHSDFISEAGQAESEG